MCPPFHSECHWYSTHWGDQFKVDIKETDTANDVLQPLGPGGIDVLVAPDSLEEVDQCTNDSNIDWDALLQAGHQLEEVGETLEASH